MSENWISFPNLGITFNLNPVAFTIGSVEVKWSSIFLVISILVGFYLWFRAVEKQKLSNRQVTVVTVVTAFFALVGARLVFVIPDNLAIMDQAYYETGNYPDTGYYNTFYKFIAFFDKDYSGLNLYGGLIFGLIALIVLCKIKKWSAGKYLDSFAIALPAAIAINSLGYITDQSSFGRHSNSLLAMNGSQIEKWVDVMRMNDIARGGASIGPKVTWTVGNPVAPTPIYEILGCLAIILFLSLISKRLLFTGEKFLWSLGLYSLIRAFTESARIDAPLFWNMRINVMFAVVAVLVCAVLIVIFHWQIKEGRLRKISKYVDSRKNDGFENDVFVQKVYQNETADESAGKNTGEAETPASVKPAPEQPAVPEPPAAEPEQSEGKGQVWTADGTDEETENKQ